MPFQDVDETAVPTVPRAPSTLERWLRKIFIEDWSLKLLALGITLVIWLAVTAENKPVKHVMEFRLNFVSPEHLDISNDPSKIIEVKINGSRAKIDAITSLDRVATVDLSDYYAGDRVVRLSRNNVYMKLPEGVSIEGFNPSSITVKLEPRVERQLNVEVRLEGKPADGYEILGTQPSFNTVTVRGPASHVNTLQKAPTETISVEGRKNTFTATQVAIDIPDQKVNVIESFVDVVIEIGQRRSKKESATLEAFNPGSIMRFRPDYMTVWIGRSSTVTIISEFFPSAINGRCSYQATHRNPSPVRWTETF
jgi:YbbR domain-containing protein